MNRSIVEGFPYPCLSENEMKEITTIEEKDLRLFDDDVRLDNNARSELNARLKELGDRYQIDIVCATTREFDETVDSEEYTLEYYKDHGLKQDGIIMMYDKEHRHYVIWMFGSVWEDRVLDVNEMWDPIDEAFYANSRSAYAGFDEFINLCESRLGTVYGQRR